LSRRDDFPLVLHLLDVIDSFLVPKIRDSGRIPVVSTLDRRVCLMKIQAMQLNFSAIHEGEAMG
jgi:hypothetical protein